RGVLDGRLGVARGRRRAGALPRRVPVVRGRPLLRRRLRRRRDAGRLRAERRLVPRRQPRPRGSGVPRRGRAGRRRRHRDRRHRLHAEGNEVALDLVVRSRLECGAEEVVPVSEALAADPSHLDGSRFVLAWEAFDLLAEADAGEARPDAVGPFRAPATGAVVPVTHAAAGEVSVRLPAGAVIYRDGLALEVREPGPGGAVLLTVTLPAFLPGSR